jgi:hypothetical protein
MLVFVEDSAQTLAPSYVQAGDLFGVGDRRGQWMEWPGACDALVGTVLVKARECWQGIIERCPRMFAHWKWVNAVQWS